MLSRQSSHYWNVQAEARIMLTQFFCCRFGSFAVKAVKHLNLDSQTLQVYFSHTGMYVTRQRCIGDHEEKVGTFRYVG